MSRPPKIMISAGEASGDRLGAGLARAILRRHPGAELLGMGGDDMDAAGVRVVQAASEVAVVGFVEVLSHLGAIRRAMRRLREAIERERPDLFVPVDFPEFNLALASRARDAGVPVVYFVSPQVWAWRRRRVRRIRRLVRRMLVLFPFETGLYRDAGVPVTFVGHPAVDSAAAPPPQDLAHRLGLDPRRETVALMPGSRRGEVTRILPPLLEAALRVRASKPGVQFVIPRAGTLPPGLVEEEVARHGLPDVVVHDGDYPGVLKICAAGAIASGTATLDAALADLPMVVVYRVRPASAVVGRALIRVDHIAMPNLIAGRRLVPELVQGGCRPDRIAEELLALLDNPDATRKMREGLAEVRDRLGGAGAFDRAAEAVMAEIDVIRAQSGSS